MRRLRLCWSLFAVVLFFVVGVEEICANEELVRQALEQLSGSYADLQLQLRDREAALRALSASLAIARTESEMFQHLWSEAQVRVQTLGDNLVDPDVVATHRQLVTTLSKLYLAEMERRRVAELLKKLVLGIELNLDVTVDVIMTKQWLAEKTADSVVVAVRQSTLATAKVLEINAKLDLVVLNVGAEQGARIGMPLIILRGDRVVAELRVVEVRPRVCGALIEKVENNVNLQAGDTAQVTKG